MNRLGTGSLSSRGYPWVRARVRGGRAGVKSPVRGPRPARIGWVPHPDDAARATLRAVSPTSHLPEHPDRLWRHPDPKPSYDVVIIGGGGHGLAAAYYLAKNHGITNVAVVERGWLAGGNMARNTAIIRSNYLWDESAAIYEHALKLWEGLEEELDYPILFSQRGVLNLAHGLQDVRDSVRRVDRKSVV